MIVQLIKHWEISMYFVGLDELRDVARLLETLVGSGELPLTQEAAVCVFLQVADHVALRKQLRPQIALDVRHWPATLTTVTKET